MGTQLLARQDLTYADYAAIDDGLRYELIHGELLTAPAPTTEHQGTSGNLYLMIASHVRKKKLGKVLSAPTDVILDDWNTVQPDILFIGSERLECIKPHAVVGPPDLVVEVLSPGSVDRDRYVKKELYERTGVREYRLADPANGTVEILVMSEGEYRLAAFASGEGTVASTVIEGLTVPLAEIMPERDRKKDGTEA